ncbi:MAG: Flp pilus assembly complex ATPase component TadA, partial [Deltaproteobacteria bacterium]|nr:Flp pilus assembly complex ATPase component TadA [Deltaproteobacteria bacterium]
VVTVEATVELSPPVGNLVQLQARSANADGIGQVTLRQLVQSALRMRPDRIIVGECRGSEVIEMLQALNTGHPGSLTTVHANSPAEALHRLELLALLGAQNLSIECIREWIRSSIDLVVQVERDAGGRRHVARIARVGPRGEELRDLYRRDR